MTSQASTPLPEMDHDPGVVHPLRPGRGVADASWGPLLDPAPRPRVPTQAVKGRNVTGSQMRSHLR